MSYGVYFNFDFLNAASWVYNISSYFSSFSRVTLISSYSAGVITLRMFYRLCTFPRKIRLSCMILVAGFSSSLRYFSWRLDTTLGAASNEYDITL
jgi:hypothetical protein